MEMAKKGMCATTPKAGEAKTTKNEAIKTKKTTSDLTQNKEQRQELTPVETPESHINIHMHSTLS